VARKFIGSNRDPSSRRTWYYRAKFDLEAYDQPDAGENQIKDITFFERQYYGTIDEQDYSIVPKQENLAVLPGGKLALNFVVDAFNIMKKRMNSAFEFSKIEGSNPFMVELNPYQAYRPPDNDYTTILQNVLVNYNSIEIPDRIGFNNITSFEDYVKNFIKIISSEIKKGYYTQTKWCRSPEASVFNSGLAISISNLRLGEDQPKIDAFIDHIDFDYYLKLALNSGFSVSKDDPWVLIFDLLSPAARPFLEKYGIFNLRQVFTSSYNRTELNDILILRNILYKYYNNYIIQYRVQRTNRANCKSSYTEYDVKDPLSLEEFNSQYPEEWFLDYYIDLRNAEEGLPYNRQAITSIKKIAKNYYKSLDRSSALGYIANRFVVQTWSKPYGYDDTLDRISKSEAQQLQAQRRRTSGGY